LVLVTALDERGRSLSRGMIWRPGFILPDQVFQALSWNSGDSLACLPAQLPRCVSSRNIGMCASTDRELLCQQKKQECAEHRQFVKLVCLHDPLCVVATTRAHARY
jgi:hypothetical protein